MKLVLGFCLLMLLEVSCATQNRQQMRAVDGDSRAKVKERSIEAGSGGVCFVFMGSYSDSTSSYEMRKDRFSPSLSPNYAGLGYYGEGPSGYEYKVDKGSSVVRNNRLADMALQEASKGGGMVLQKGDFTDGIGRLDTALLRERHRKAAIVLLRDLVIRISGKGMETSPTYVSTEDGYNYVGNFVFGYEAQWEVVNESGAVRRIYTRGETKMRFGKDFSPADGLAACALQVGRDFGSLLQVAK